MNVESRFSDREFDSREVSSGWTTLRRGLTASPSRGMTRGSRWPPWRTGSKCGARGASMMCSLEFLELPQTRRVGPTAKVLSGKNPVSSRKGCEVSMEIFPTKKEGCTYVLLWRLLRSLTLFKQEVPFARAANFSTDRVKISLTRTVVQFQTREIQITFALVFEIQ